MSSNEGKILELVTDRDVQVQECEIGFGVFSNRSFRAGDIIGIATGEIIFDPDYSSDYCVELSSTMSIEPGAPFRFLNHCCEPNAEFASDEVSKRNQIPDLYVYACKAISAGEQILIDYQWPAHYAIPCECESKNCRGWVVCDEELHLIEFE